MLANKRHLSIDTALNHRNLITVWRSISDKSLEHTDGDYWNANYIQQALGERVCTTHFNRTYNGFFRRFKNFITKNIK